MEALKIAFNLIYVASFIALMVFIASNATESYTIDSQSGATKAIDCMNCDEID